MAHVQAEALGEFGILLAHVAEAVDHPRPAEQLDLQALAAGAHAVERVEQQFHRLDAVTQRLGAFALGRLFARQQEMVHAADAGQGIAHAGRDAGPEDRPQHHFGILGHGEFALHHMDAFGAGRIRSEGVGFGCDHVSFPNTASIFSFSVCTVKGLTR